jgi:pyruvate kinase
MQHYQLIQDQLLKESQLLKQLQELHHSVLLEGTQIYQTWQPKIQRLSFNHSAQNLAHYLVFRRHDLRALPECLTQVAEK